VSGYIGWAGVAAMIVVAFIGGKYGLAGQRQQARTQAQASKIQARSQESRLALDMAIETRDRLDILEDWEDVVVEWWNTEHRPRDEIRDRALLAANPAAFQNIPEMTPMPRPKRRK
jgi:hypothetical protein